MEEMDDLEAAVTANEQNILAIRDALVTRIAELTRRLDSVILRIVHSEGPPIFLEHLRAHARQILARRLWYEHLDWVLEDLSFYLKQMMFELRATGPILGLVNMVDLRRGSQVQDDAGDITMEEMNASYNNLIATLKGGNDRLTTLARKILEDEALENFEEPDPVALPHLQEQNENN